MSKKVHIPYKVYYITIVSTIYSISFLLIFNSHSYAAIPPGYTHSGNTIQTIVGNPQGTGNSGGIGGPSKGHGSTNDLCVSYKNSPDNFLQSLYTRYTTWNFPNNTIFSPKNFGDPVCDYTKNGLASLIHKIDLQYNATKYDFCWYNVIVLHESAYDPNDEQLIDPYDPDHAWGNFQMGRGKNGKLDHGDVDWQTQVENALTYNYTLIGSNFHYWFSRHYDWVHCPQ